MTELTDESRKTERYLCFTLGADRYAIPLLLVKEVIANTQTRPIPQSPAHFRGIMNLRGQVISVIDLHKKLQIKETQAASQQCIIIVDFDSLLLGFVVDSVDRVAMWDKSALSGAPATQTAAGLIVGVAREENGMILILDLRSALSVDDFRSARAQLGNAA